MRHELEQVWAPAAKCFVSFFDRHSVEFNMAVDHACENELRHPPE